MGKKSKESMSTHCPTSKKGRQNPSSFFKETHQENNKTNMEINDFISSADPTPVADVILAHAMQAGKTWNDQTDYEKQQSMIAAIIAYLEQEKRKP